MMDDEVSELLAKVEDALWVGDQRTASLLIHKILLQDFTNRQAWQLLHSIRGGDQPLEEFQQSFALRFYPHLAYLLWEKPAAIPKPLFPVPDPQPLVRVPAEEPAPLPVEPELPAVELEAADDEPAPLPVEPELPAVELEAAAEELAILPVKPEVPIEEPVVQPAELELPAAELATPAEEPVVQPAELELPAADLAAPTEEPTPLLPAPELPAGESTPLPADLEQLMAAFELQPAEFELLEPSDQPQRVEPEAPLELLEEDLPAEEIEANPLPAEWSTVEEKIPLGLPKETCPSCGAPLYPQAKFCAGCGNPLQQPSTPMPEQPLPSLPPDLADTQPVPLQKPAAASPLPARPAPLHPKTEGLLHLHRLKSAIAADSIFSIWIDGQPQVEQLSAEQEHRFPLPAGQHTLMVRLADKARAEILIDLQPGAELHAICQADRPMLFKTRLTLKIVPLAEVQSLQR